MNWIRPALRTCGIPLVPASVICPEHNKTVTIERDGRARVDVRETLVFLHQPHSGDLSDTCTIDAQSPLTSFIRQSPDAIDVRQSLQGKGAVAVEWKPKDAVVPYALYDHQYSWFAPGSHSQPALFAEYQCDKKTGNFVLEMITTQGFETAVAFPRPGWLHMRSERTLIKFALKQLEAESAQRPTISDTGEVMQWRIVGPKLGSRHVCVVFHRHGVALWQEELKKGTLLSRINQLMGKMVPTT